MPPAGQRKGEPRTNAGAAERVTIAGGSTVLVRPIHPSDKRALVEGLELASARSRYARFLTPMTSFSDADLRYLTEVDHHDHEALVAVTPQAQEPIGVARYVRSADDPAAAEVAVIVVDAWQRRGVGSALLDRIAARASSEGIERFTATVLASNASVVELLERLGRTEQLGAEHGVIELRVELPAAPGRQTPLAAALRAAGSGAITGAARLWRSVMRMLLEGLGR